MKKSVLRFLLIAQLFLAPLFITGIFADPPGPPSPGNSPIGNGGSPVGKNNMEGSPIEDGIGILLVLGITYGAFKVYEIWKKKLELKGEDKSVGNLSEVK